MFHKYAQVEKGKNNMQVPTSVVSIYVDICMCSLKKFKECSMKWKDFFPLSVNVGVGAL